MKTLKKVLSLVLVVAMIASMCIVGAAATEEETLYPEAAAVVEGLGIFEGDGTGTMNYKEGLTRAQAAKIITFMMLGKDIAESLKVSAAPFADVAATHWAAGYIAYLKNQGIVSGKGNGFDPNGPVTDVEFAKMLLVAVGYGANGEFEGNGFTINTITFAQQNGIFDDTLTTNFEDGLTREEAMLYLFNGLQVPTVKYNKTFEAYYTGKSALDPVTGVVDPANPTITVNGVTVDTPYAYTLGYTKYALYLSSNGATNDDLGRPCASWYSDGVEIVENVATTKTDAVAFWYADSATIYTNFGKAAVENLNTDLDNKVTYYSNGSEVSTAGWEAIVKGEATNAIYADYIEYYLTSNNGQYELTIVAYNEIVGTIDRVAKDFVRVAYPVYGGTATIDLSVEDYDLAGLAKNDVVLLVMGNDRVAGQNNVIVKSINEIAPIVGTYTADTATGMKVIDGVPYLFGWGQDSSVSAMQKDLSYYCYFNSMGFIVKAIYYAGTVSTNYLYVSDVEAQVYNPSVLNGAPAKVAVSVAMAEGGTSVLFLDVLQNYAYAGDADSYGYYVTLNGKAYLLTAANVAALNANDGSVLTAIDGTQIAVGGWMAYSTNDDGEVVLAALPAIYAATADNVQVVHNIGTTITVGNVNYTANSKTVLTIIDAYGSALSYTGVKNFPVTDPTYAHVLYTYDFGSTAINSIVVYNPYIIHSATTTYAYCASTESITSTATTYKFYVDGAPLYATVPSAYANCVAGEIYTLTVSGGYYYPTAIEAIGYQGATVGTVNEGKTSLTGNTNDGRVPAQYPSQDGNGYAANFGYTNGVTSVTSYYEWATVASVDDNWFFTVAVDGNDQIAVNDSVAQQGVASVQYFMDGNTVIYDCTANGAIVDGISEGDVFVAVIDTNNTGNIYDGYNYCVAIWIVG